MAFTPINNSNLAAMFGGLSKSAPATNQAASSALPSYLGGGQSMAYPQAMPGQLEAIAAQLSAGFGQPASAYMQQMDAMYNPVNVGQQPAPATATPAAAATAGVGAGLPKGSAIPIKGMTAEQLRGLFGSQRQYGGSR